MPSMMSWQIHLARQQNPEPAREGETTEQAERRTVFSQLWGASEEILSAPDPLAAVLDSHKTDAKDDREDDVDKYGNYGYNEG